MYVSVAKVLVHTMLASDFVPKEGTSPLGVAGVPASAWINPLLSIKLDNSDKERKEKKKGGEVRVLINYANKK